MDLRHSSLKLRPVPVSLEDANRFVGVLHRHNGALPGAKMAVAAMDQDGLVRGVAIAGIPKARMLNDGYTLEINRVCTTGAANACSFLYASCLRAAKALGYWRVVTYTLASEPGTSLKASGWRRDADLPARSWPEERGRGFGQHDSGPKVRWEIAFGACPPRLRWPEPVSDLQPPALFEDVA